jgi:hypothetical protein
MSTWSDVERLERQIMAAEPPDSFLRQTFDATKAKLRQCLAAEKELDARAEQDSLDRSIKIRPGETIPFAFRCRAPHRLRERPCEVQFKVSYRDPDTKVSGVSGCSQTLQIQASFFAVPLGAVLGAVAGYVIRLAYVAPPLGSWKQQILYGIASCLLALVLAFLTGRSPEVRRIITVQDFSGGFIIGAISGLFTENLITYLRSFVPTRTNP